MSRRGIVSITREIAGNIVEDFGYDLVDVEYVKEFDNYFLRIYIDKKGGVDLDDCQKVSELVSLELDKKDPTEDAYYLEVSSPGLDRPLKTDRDLERNLGKEVEINLYQAIENRKRIEATLKGYDEENIILDLDGEEIEIAKDLISLVRLVIKF